MLRPLLIGAMAALAAGPAFAADPFFKGKTVTIITSTGAGGTYDTVARAVARRERGGCGEDPLGGCGLGETVMSPVWQERTSKIPDPAPFVPAKWTIGPRG